MIPMIARFIGREQGRIKFDETKKPMKIGGHAFSADMNMVDLKGKTKVSISVKTKEMGAIDLKLQEKADEYEKNSRWWNFHNRYERAQNTHHKFPCITS